MVLMAPSCYLNPAFSTKNVDLCSGARSIVHCFRFCSKSARRRDRTDFSFRGACLSSGSGARDSDARKDALQDAAYGRSEVREPQLCSPTSALRGGASPSYG
jgi:hypothetical protein